MIQTSISLYDGSNLVAIGSPEQIWTNQRHDDFLVVTTLGGGTACLPCADVRLMTLHRRGDDSSGAAGSPA